MSKNTCTKLMFPKAAPPKTHMPENLISKIKCPKITWPKITSPKMTCPKVVLPNTIVPKITFQKITFPRITCPKLTCPKITWPIIIIPKATSSRNRIPKKQKSHHIIFPRAKLFLLWGATFCRDDKELWIRCSGAPAVSKHLGVFWYPSCFLPRATACAYPDTRVFTFYTRRVLPTTWESSFSKIFPPLDYFRIICPVCAGGGLGIHLVADGAAMPRHQQPKLYQKIILIEKMRFLAPAIGLGREKLNFCRKKWFGTRQILTLTPNVHRSPLKSDKFNRGWGNEKIPRH